MQWFSDVVIVRQQIARHHAVGFVTCRRKSHRDIGGAGHELLGLAIVDDLRTLHLTYFDRLVRTGLNTSGRFSDGQPVGAHVALANDTLGGTVDGNIVRTHKHAVLTTNALIIQMLDDSRDGVFFVSIDRASMHASRFETVMTRRCHVLNDRLRF